MFTFSPEDTKDKVIQTITYALHTQQLEVVEENFTKPWGAYWRIADNNLQRFIEYYFQDEDIEMTPQIPMSPKILLVAPGQRLSWQYHFRRGEIWKVVYGPVRAIISPTDVETEIKTYKNNQIIKIKPQERHRLLGADNWGVIAEIWQHTDINNPSNEEDNVRLADDYGREGTNTRN